MSIPGESCVENEKVGQKGGILFVLLCIVLFYPPFFRGLFFDSELLPTHVFSFVLFSVWMMTKIKNGSYRMIQNAADLFACMVVGMYLITIIFGVNIRLSIAEFLKYTNYLFLYFMVKEYGRHYKNREYLLNTMLLASVIVCIIGLGSAIGSWNYRDAYVQGRIYSSFQYPNALAAYLGAMFFVSMGFFLQKERILYKILYSVIGCTLLFTLVLTYSRGMWLLMPVLVILYTIILPGHKKVLGFVNMGVSSVLAGTLTILFQKSLLNPAPLKSWGIVIFMMILSGSVGVVFHKTNRVLSKIRYKLLYILLAAMILLSALVGVSFIKDLPHIDEPDQISVVTKGVLKVMPDSLIWRFKDVNNQEKNVQGRLYFYKDAFKIIKDYPIVGTGGGGWATLYQMYQSFGYTSNQAHNYFLQLWIEIGTVGWMGFVLFILYTIKVVYKKMRQERENIIYASMFIGMITLILHSMMDFDLTYASLCFILWTWLGLLNSGDESEKLFKGSQKNMKAVGLVVSCMLIIASASLYYGDSNQEKGEIAMQAGDLKGAINYLESATTFDPFKGETKALLGKVYLYAASKVDQSFYPKAKKNYEEAIELEPHNINILKNAAQFYLASDQIEEALKMIDRTVDVQPMNKEAYETKSKMYYKASEYFLNKKQKDKAQNYIKGLIKIQEEFNKAAVKSTTPMKMTEKTKEYIQKGKELIQDSNQA